MDKRTIAAFVLIGLVFLSWSLFFSPKAPPPKQGADTTAIAGQQAGDSTTTPGGDTNTTQPGNAGVDPNDPYAQYKTGDWHFVTIETPLYTAVLNSKGGLLQRFTLKKYKSWYGDPVQLINDSAGFPGELGILFKDENGKEINTRDFQFTIEEQGNIDLAEGDSVVVIARLAGRTDSVPATAGTADSNAPAPAKALPTIEKRFVFHGNRYDIGMDVAAPGLKDYRIDWIGGLKYQEHNSVDESAKAQAYVKVDDELQHLNADKNEAGKSQNYNGSISWVGTKIKYFAAALIPQKPISTQATVAGTAVPADSNGLVESYNFALQVPAGAAGTQSFNLFVGPLEYDLARGHDLTGMVDYGFLEFIVRPISEYVLLPIFRFLHSLIANWGLVIIVFSILIRGALWPLSIPQIKSSEKMRLVQPVITEMRDKYKDDQQKMQMETMKVYREYGVNPVGGCLPMLLQLPVLYALWNTLSNAIDLRQAGFAFWIHDLSIPDTLVKLPFSLPLLGTQLSGLALIMGVTLFVQQKMMITDPKQKMLVYIMPVFLTIAFNYLPSGLNLYYFVFNLLSIGQQYYLRNMSKSTMTLEDMKKQAKGKKKGWLAQKMEEAQKMAEMQNRTPPGKGGTRR